MMVDIENSAVVVEKVFRFWLKCFDGRFGMNFFLRLDLVFFF